MYILERAKIKLAAFFYVFPKVAVAWLTLGGAPQSRTRQVGGSWSQTPATHANSSTPQRMCPVEQEKAAAMTRPSSSCLTTIFPAAGAGRRAHNNTKIIIILLLLIPIQIFTNIFISLDHVDIYISYNFCPKSGHTTIHIYYIVHTKVN